jgi:hypothetical protein
MSPRVVLTVGSLVLAAACGGRPVDVPAPRIPPVPRAVGSPVAVLPEHPDDGEPGAMWAALPDGPAFHLWQQPGPGAVPAGKLPAGNDFGQRMALFSESSFRDRTGARWLKVRLPIRPNGSTAWVRARDVQLAQVHDRIVIDLSERTLWHYRDGEILDRFSVAVGSPTYPTTPGRFFVWALVDYPHPSGPYGSYALGLSGFSDVITNWPGGGRMAIHGTADPTDRGRAVSHGCIRVFNPQLEHLRNVPLGTPVVIRP